MTRITSLISGAKVACSRRQSNKMLRAHVARETRCCVLTSPEKRDVACSRRQRNKSQRRRVSVRPAVTLGSFFDSCFPSVLVLALKKKKKKSSVSF